MQESTKELQVIPQTTSKDKGMTGNHSFALKQLWVNETELVPIVQIQIVSDGETDCTSTKLPLHLSPN